MSTDSQQHTHHSAALEFKSSTFSVPVLVLASNDRVIIEQQLQEKVQRAPEFFKNSPLVLDLQELNKRESDINVSELVHLIRKLELLPIGLRGGTAEQNQQALELGIPVHSGHNVTAASETQKQPQAKIDVAPEPQVFATATTLITLPVRSGQRIYAEGDLVILAQVSAGAEILAEGNIHVYGSLRGRALAGVLGNTAARIFCSDLQAELISIAGNYKVSEDLNGTVLNQPVQIYLQNHALVIKDI
ncbi:MAG: septum site-determining protein MinC [Methylobacter sp.]|jgi:septum site-determining protein MinC|nr:septum site-determining protein MinC [Methylobacter sp.]